MMRSLFGLGFSWFFGVFALAACSGKSIGAVEDGGVDGSVDAPHAACCPIDSERAGCMHLGGANVDDGASCVTTCDFFCSENWRIENDSHGCPAWKFDTRQPAEGEGPQCNALDGDAAIDGAVDSATSDGGSLNCGDVACDPATEFCYVNEDPHVTYHCAKIPASCDGGQPTCECVEAAESTPCGNSPGLPTCFEDAGVVFGCAH